MKKKRKNLLEVKKESIAALNRLQSFNIAGGNVKVGLTSLNMCTPTTGPNTVTGNTSDKQAV